ncbi:hypothetical protein LWI29_010435 [Acer saccharum]|uniref:PdxS/SNZ N-terminal domain-containing protein n=1 Tax=Acer saccharum TaxID=4024 RepID=A0AA39TPS1_ACESA|nr:hypothetical protein LWI29_010435 [Acer saccharum]
MGDTRDMDEDEVFAISKMLAAPYDLVAQTKQMGRLPVVQFAAGVIVTPADDAVGTVGHYNDQSSCGREDAMAGINLSEDRIEQFGQGED